MSQTNEHVPRPQNDAFWQVFGNGPSTENFTNFDTTNNIDDVVTAYSSELFTAIQALTNMIGILSRVVDQYDIQERGEYPNIPEGIAQIYDSGTDILKAEKILYKNARIFLWFEKIRKDWGSIDAFANAPEVDRRVWYDRTAETYN